MANLAELERRIEKLERAELDGTTLKAIDRIGQSIGETISTRLAAMFDAHISDLNSKIGQLDAKIDQKIDQLDAKVDQKIGQLDAKVDQHHAETMAQFDKLFNSPQEH